MNQKLADSDPDQKRADWELGDKEPSQKLADHESDQKPASQNLADQVSDQELADQQLADQKLADQKLDDQTLAEKTGAEERKPASLADVKALHEHPSNELIDKIHQDAAACWGVESLQRARATAARRTLRLDFACPFL